MLLKKQVCNNLKVPILTAADDILIFYYFFLFFIFI